MKRSSLQRTLLFLGALPLFLSGCQGKGATSAVSSSSLIPAPSIADMSLDLLNPENQVVPYGLYTNATLSLEGKTLTDSEFLLGSKIAKSYLKALGPRETPYVFTFSCDQGKDDFALTLTDASALALTIDDSLDGAVYEEGPIALGDFVQVAEDSYQEISLDYTLKKEGVVVALASTYAPGTYTYSCAISRGGSLVESVDAAFTVLSSSAYFDYCFEPANLVKYLSVSDGDTSAISVSGDSLIFHSDGVRSFALASALVAKGKSLGKNLIGLSIEVANEVVAPSDTNSVFSATYAQTFKAYPGNLLPSRPYLISTPIAMLNPLDLSYKISFALAGDYTISHFEVWDSDWLNIDVSGDYGGISLRKNAAGNPLYLFYNNADTDKKQFILKRSLVDEALVAGKNGFIATFSASEVANSVDYKTVWFSDNWCSPNPALWRTAITEKDKDYTSDPISLSNLALSQNLGSSISLQFGTVMIVTVSEYHFA